MLVGKAGVNISDFYELEPKEAFLLIDAYNEKQEEKWLHTRQVLATIINVNVEKKHRVKPEKIIKLNIDKKKNEIEESFYLRTLKIFEDEEEKKQGI